MSLKRLVNDRDLYDSLTEELDKRLTAVYKAMVSAQDLNELLRFQGEARALTKLLSLKEKVNNG